jgi:hypothetical protein
MSWLRSCGTPSGSLLKLSFRKERGKQSAFGKEANHRFNKATVRAKEGRETRAHVLKCFVTDATYPPQRQEPINVLDAEPDNLELDGVGVGGEEAEAEEEGVEAAEAAAVPAAPPGAQRVVTLAEAGAGAPQRAAWRRRAPAAAARAAAPRRTAAARHGSVKPGASACTRGRARQVAAAEGGGELCRARWDAGRGARQPGRPKVCRPAPLSAAAQERWLGDQQPAAEPAAFRLGGLRVG